MSICAEPLFPWLTQPLSQAVNVLRGHAVLVHGQRGVGQFELLLAIAAASLCETDRSQRSAHGLACGQCAACLMVDARTHPDLMVVIPPVLQEALGWSGGDDAVDGESAKSKAKPSKEIKVDAVRAAVAFAQQTASRGRGKVVVFYPAERFRKQAAK